MSVEEVSKIPLKNKKGEVVAESLCDTSDYEILSKSSWHKDVDGYAVASINRKTVRMHRYVMQLHEITIEEGTCVNHKNHERLDNRFKNLEILTNTQNSQFRKKRKSSSMYHGVRKQGNKYSADVMINREVYHIGTYDTEILAARAYDTFVYNHPNKPYHKLNFPDDVDKCNLKIFDEVNKRQNRIKGVFETKRGYVCKIKHNNIMMFKTFKTKDEATKAHDEYTIANKLNRKLYHPELNHNYSPHLEIKTKISRMVDENTVAFIPSKSKNEVFVDKCDYERIKHYICYIREGYPNICNSHTRKNVILSRFVMNVTDPMMCVDHIDNNKNNNTKQNLRILTFSENAQNQPKRKNASSKYYGVYKKKNSWICQVIINNNKTYDKSFKIEEVAARAYDLHIIDNFPNSYKKLNFKDWTEPTKQEWRDKIAQLIESKCK